MRRIPMFTDEHDDFRRLARSFFDNEVAPHAQDWERDGIVDRGVWAKAGALGLLGWEAPEAFGGAGIKDFRYNMIMTEEYIHSGSVGFGFQVHNDVMPPYLLDLTNEEQKARWLPRWVSGETITAIAMSEPGAGSDLRSIRTTARLDGDHYVLDGSKTYITNGILSDLVVVVARTDPAAGHRGISLIVIERGMDGFSRGRNLDKVGLHAQDTAELFFDSVRVPRENLLGEEGRGFYYLMGGLPQERLGVGVTAVATMERALDLTIEFVSSREMFGGTLADLQNTRFVLADVRTVVDAGRAYVDRAVQLHLDGQLSATEAASVKVWASERQFEVLDSCMQLFGGAGYMNEYEISRLWRDARINRVLAGSNETMRDIIGRSLTSGTAPQADRRRQEGLRR